MMTLLAMLLLGVGVIFNVLAAVGALKFPDAFTRAHAIGMGDTLGVLLVLCALMVLHGPGLLSAKLVLLLALFFIINPTVVHAVLQAALDANVKPWSGGRRK